MQLRAPCASAEDLTFREEDEEGEGESNRRGDDEDDVTPTPSLSSEDDDHEDQESGSLARTPVHRPKVVAANALATTTSTDQHKASEL